MRTDRPGSPLLLIAALGIFSSCEWTPLRSETSVPDGEILGFEPIERVSGAPEAGPEKAPPRDDGGEASSAADPAVAEIAGRPLRLSELSAYLVRHYAAESAEAADSLIEAELVRREAARLGAPPPDPGAIARAVDGEVLALARRVSPSDPTDADALESYLAAGGRSVAAYRAELSSAAETRLLLARVARFEELTTASVTIQEAVFADRASADRAARDLEEGADFGLLAARRSVSPTRAANGKLPAAPLADLEPAVRSAVEALPLRVPSRVVDVEAPGGDRYAIYRVLERRAGLDAPTQDAWSLVLRSLEERPLADDELLRWTRRNHRRYGVRVMLPTLSGG